MSLQPKSTNILPFLQTKILVNKRLVQRIALRTANGFYINKLPTRKTS